MQGVLNAAMTYSAPYALNAIAPYSRAAALSGLRALFLPFTCLCVMLLQGCTGPGVKPPSTLTAPQANSTPLTPEQQRVGLLYALHRQWRGTPYLYGGASQEGIDCSALIQLGYRQKFNQELPRTTEDMITLGEAVPHEELSAGDLVFFKTGPFSRHAGIYIENGRFLHASSSKGVIISSLRNAYWKLHYWTARRPGGVINEGI